MKERIQKIIDLEKLTASKFADIIGVQRSSVSHIISGRNKPSLDFVQKILSKFPEINTDWLLSGKGSITRTQESAKVSENQAVEMQPVSPITEPVQQNQEFTETNYNINNNINSNQTVQSQPQAAAQQQSIPADNQHVESKQVYQQPMSEPQYQQPQAQPNYVSQGFANGQQFNQPQFINNQPFAQAQQQYVNNQGMPGSQQGKQPIDIMNSNPKTVIVFYSDKTFDWFSPNAK